MTNSADDDRAPILDAVQSVLTAFGEQVKEEFDSLRASVAAEQTARLAAEERVAELAAALELSEQRAAAQRDEMSQLIDTSIIDARTPLDERIESLESWSDASTDAANELEARLSAAEVKTDEVAGDVATEAAQRSEAIDAVTVSAAGVLAAHASIESRIDQVETVVQRELEAASATLDDTVGTKITAAETRMSEQLAGAEQKVNDELGVRVAEVSAEFDRVADGVESSITALNERSNDIDTRLGGLIERVTSLEAVVAEIDVDAIDDLSERVSTAAGEAVLIRIETERFQESVKEANDKMVLRISDVESQLQAQEMDVETAVQLERLEEVERALIELDPAQFVRVGDDGPASAAGPRRADVPFTGSTSENDGDAAGRIDAPPPPKPTLPSSG